tara:strand:+ start:253 stop:450 length:198 start_codon:yes stop_codon:yes gene_type:complete
MTFSEIMYYLEKVEMDFSDKFAARIMLIVQNKVREVNANEDFKDWSLDYILKLNDNHKEPRRNED